MSKYQLETKKQLVEFLPFQHKGFVQVALYNKSLNSFALTKVAVLYLSLTSDNLNKLQAYKSVSALIKYAKANQIQQDAVTPCPVPLPTTQARGIQIERNKRSASCPKVTTHAPYSGNSSNGASLLFIDTETTGLSYNDEIVEIAVVDIDENIVFESLVKPSKSIPKKATSTHGITNKMVANAPSFAEIWADLTAVIADKTLVFYNAKFDKRMIAQSVHKSFEHSKRLDFAHLYKNKTSCLMTRYAFNCVPNGRWQTLTSACDQQNINIDDVPNHRAAGDAIKTVRLYKQIGIL